MGQGGHSIEGQQTKSFIENLLEVIMFPFIPPNNVELISPNY